MTIAPRTVSVGGHEYRIGQLSCFDSLHVARSISFLAPVFVGEVYGQIMKLLEASKDRPDVPAAKLLDEIVDIVRVSEPFLYRISMMDRAAFEGVVKTCLSCVERHDGRSYGRVVIDGQMMYADIDAPTALELTLDVLVREIRPFFSALCRQGFSAEQAASTSPA